MTATAEAAGVRGEMATALAGFTQSQRHLCELALRELGATPDQLADAEREALDRDGFVILPGILSRDEIDALNEQIDARIAAAREQARDARARNAVPRGVVFDEEIVLRDLVNQGPVFDVGISHPHVMAAIAHVLGGDMKLAYLHMREPNPGAGQQGLHPDIYEDTVHPVHYFCNSIWMLDDFTEDNGPTRFVPGSHRYDVTPITAMDNRMADHPDQVLATGPAGSVIVFDGHVWHGGTTNRGGGRRRAMFSAWIHRGSYPMDDQRRLLHPDTYARLDDARRFLIDVHGALPLEPPDPLICFSLY